VTPARPAGARRLLHPLVPALALVVFALAGAAAARRGAPLAGASLAGVAGCAAGFANSGST
jgi:hypothetical protein